jgi:hypothetical protein
MTAAVTVSIAAQPPQNILGRVMEIDPPTSCVWEAWFLPLNDTGVAGSTFGGVLSVRGYINSVLRLPSTARIVTRGLREDADAA